MGDFSAGGEHAHDGESGHGFAAARFSDDAEGFLRIDGEVDSAKDGCAVDFDVEIFDFEEGH